MSRHDFRRFFAADRQVVLPVIHVLDEARTAENIRTLMEVGAHGCFLINHDFLAVELVSIVQNIRQKFPSLWMGVNFLGISAPKAFDMLADLQKRGCRIDGYWSDDAQIDEFASDQDRATKIYEARCSSGWDGLYFGGVAVKYQRIVEAESYQSVAAIATQFMDVITTTGPGTGYAAAPEKIEAFRRGAGDHPIAVASGITPENAHLYRDADCFIVATGINKLGNFYDIDADRLSKLLSA